MLRHRSDVWPFLIWIVALGFMIACSSGRNTEVQEEDFAMSEEVPMPSPLPPPTTQPTLPDEQLADGMSETMWQCRPHFGGRYRLIRFLLAILLQDQFGYGPPQNGVYDYRIRGFRSGSRAMGCLNRLSGYVGQYRNYMNAGYYSPQSVNGFMGNMVHWAYDPGYGNY